MRARDILAHFHGLVAQYGLPVDLKSTADRIVAGSAEAPVRRILVAWMNTTEVVRRAIAEGFDMIICHEATMWGPEPDILNRPEGTVSQVVRPGESEADTVIRWEPGTTKWELAKAKRRLLDDSGIVAMRLHDVWDLVPEVGIPWAWARFLGIDSRPVAFGGRYGEHHRYNIPKTTVGELASGFAARSAELGEGAVQLFGRRDKRISSVGLGTGCGAGVYTFFDMGCECAVICDDTWESRCFLDIAFAMDNDYPLIRYNHGTSEEPGMVTLADYLRRNFPEVDVVHHRQGACFCLVGADRSRGR